MSKIDKYIQLKYKNNENNDYIEKFMILDQSVASVDAFKSIAISCLIFMGSIWGLVFLSPYLFLDEINLMITELNQYHNNRWNNSFINESLNNGIFIKVVEYGKLTISSTPKEIYAALSKTSIYDDILKYSSIMFGVVTLLVSYLSIKKASKAPAFSNDNLSNGYVFIQFFFLVILAGIVVLSSCYLNLSYGAEMISILSLTEFYIGTLIVFLGISHFIKEREYHKFTNKNNRNEYTSNKFKLAIKQKNDLKNEIFKIEKEIILNDEEMKNALNYAKSSKCTFDELKMIELLFTLYNDEKKEQKIHKSKINSFEKTLKNHNVITHNIKNS